MRLRAFLMYPAHAVLLNFMAELTQNHIYNGHTFVVFLPVEHEEDYSTARE